MPRIGITAAELALMRSDIAFLLPGTAVLLELTQSPDGQGGFTDSWSAFGTVTCRIDSIGGGRKNVAADERFYHSWTLTVPYDTDLRIDNRVTIDQYTYAVTDISDNASWPVVLRATVERINESQA